MKEYNHIQGPSRAPNKPCIAFDKLDGTLIRAEWNSKRGWNKFGTRKMMINRTHNQWGSAVDLFLEKYNDSIPEVILSEKKWKNTRKITVFCEYWGPNSFAGLHDPNDKMDITLFDVCVNKFCIMSPKDFVKRFQYLDIPKVIYEGNFCEQFKQDIYNGVYPVTFEGVVVKGGESHNLWFSKMKTRAWLDKVRRLHPRFYDPEDDYTIDTNKNEHSL